MDQSGLLRWIGVGLVCMGFGLGLLYLLVDVGGCLFPIAAAINFLTTSLLRFALNEWWVFRSRAFEWLRIGKYYASLSTSFALWWLVANWLVISGVHYLVASVGANGVSVFVTLLLNFLWVWRRPQAAKLGTEPLGSKPNTKKHAARLG